MILTIHGRDIFYDGNECGIYKCVLGGLTSDYAQMDINTLVSAVNSLDKSGAIRAISELRNMARDQFDKNATPKSFGSPILRGPQATPIEEVRDYIKNTEFLMEDILVALIED